jgi:hypothetical protein
MALQPSNGDAVVTRDPDRRASWVVSAFPGLAQLRYRSAALALDAATRYASHARVSVWLADPWRVHVPDATQRPRTSSGRSAPRGDHVGLRAAAAPAPPPSRWGDRHQSGPTRSIGAP